MQELFNDIQNKDTILNHLLPQEIESKYNFRRKTKYPLPRCRTNWFKNTLIPYGLFNFQKNADYKSCKISSQYNSINWFSWKWVLA